MKHKDKLKLARKLLTPQEIKDHVPPFQSVAWDERQKAIKIRISNRIIKIKKIKKKVEQKES